MAKTLTLAAQNFLPQMLTGSAEIAEYIQNKTNVCNFEMAVAPGQAMPQEGSEMIYKDGSRFLFGGFVTRVQPTELGIGSRFSYKVEVSDYSWIFNNKIVRRGYVNQTLKYIVEDIMADFIATDYDFTTTNVEIGPTIPSITFDHISIRKCFEKLQKLTGYSWSVDYEKNLYFKSTTATAAPESVTDASGNVEDVNIEYDVSQVRNSVIVIGSDDGEQSATLSSETFVGDGETRSWALEDKPSEVSSITINGVTKQFSLDVNERDTDIFTYSFSGQSFRLTNAQTTPTGSETIVINYYPRVDIIVQRQDAASIAFFAALDGGDGVYEYTIKEPSITSKAEAIERAEQELLQFADPLVTGVFNTRTSLLSGGSYFRPGQYLTVNLPVWGLATDTVFLIQEVRTTIFEDGTNTEYKYEVRFGGKIANVETFLASLASETAEVSDVDKIKTIHGVTDSVEMDDSQNVHHSVVDPPFFYGPWPRYRVKVTIVAGKVASDLSGFPVFVDLTDMPAHFWANVNADGGDIRVTTSDGETQVPLDVANVNVGSQIGEIFFKGDLLSASDNVFYVHYGNADMDLEAAASTYGYQNVWTGYHGVYHGTANALDRSSNAKNGTLYEMNQGVGYLDFLGHQKIAESAATLAGTTALSFGKITTYQRVAQSFTIDATTTARLDIMIRKLANTGSPTTTATFAIHADSAGSPAGASLASTTVQWNGTGALVQNTDFIAASLSGAAITGLATSTTYWLVFTHTTPSDANYLNIAYDPSGTYGVLKYYDGAAWNTVAGSLRFRVFKSGYFDRGSGTPNMSTRDMEMTVRLKKTDNTYEDIMDNGYSTQSHFEINRTASNNLAWRPNSTSGSSPADIASGVATGDGTWRNYTWRLNATNQRLFVNGVSAGTATVNNLATDQALRYFGQVQNRLNSTYGQALLGQMKFIRIRTAQSDNFILAESNNLDAPATFYALSDYGASRVGRYNLSEYT